MAAAIDGVKEAYLQLSSGQAIVPLRSHIDIRSHNGISLTMPAYLPGRGDLAVKIVSVYPDNVKRKEPAIYASVIVLDAESGRPVALLEGGTITAIRTGAASGAATDVLARKDVQVVAIFGTGVQARTQLEAVATVRPLTEARIYSLNRNQALQFAEELSGLGPIPKAITVANSPEEAIDGADIICTATTSKKPVFNGHDLMPGTHVNAIGSFTPEMQEVDLETILRSTIFVDSKEAVLEEAGDLLVPMAAGEITEEAIFAELGEVIGGQKSGRVDSEQITYFKSVGVAIQDAVAGRIALENANDLGLGKVISLD
jgi:ornithine cyclodeaminase